MTKEELELKVKELSTALTQFENEQIQLASKLKVAKKQLNDANKPVISIEVRDEIREAVSEGIRGYQFDNADNYDIDFELNYDNRIEVSNIEFKYKGDLEENICSEIKYLFKIENNDEELAETVNER